MPAGDGGGADAVAGVLLAAGSSRRMGRNKLLLDVDGSPAVRRAAERALSGGLRPVLVVVGHEAERVRAALAGLACTVVSNPDSGAGIGSSLRAGVAALPAGTAAVTVLLADMPFVSAEMLAQVVAAFRATSAPLVVSDYGGVLAPPMLFARRLFPELLAVADERAAQEVALRHRDAAAVVAWPRSFLADFDSPEDYARLAQTLQHQPRRE